MMGTTFQSNEEDIFFQLMNEKQKVFIFIQKKNNIRISEFYRKKKERKTFIRFLDLFIF